MCRYADRGNRGHVTNWSKALAGCLVMFGFVLVSYSPSWADSGDGNPADGDQVILRTGGGPGGPYFDVALAAAGHLDVVRHSLPMTPTGQFNETRTTVDLDASEATQLIGDAVHLDDFSVGCGATQDGTNADLVVVHGGVETHHSCGGAARWPEGTKTQTWLAQLNAHLPTSARVF